jgi:hypothetical protein
VGSLEYTTKQTINLISTLKLIACIQLFTNL